MAWVLARLGKGGRLVIPAEYRKELGVEPGDELVLILEEKSLRILTPQEGIRRAQAIIRSHIPEDGTLLSDELIAERRRDSKLE